MCCTAAAVLLQNDVTLFIRDLQFLVVIIIWFAGFEYKPVHLSILQGCIGISGCSIISEIVS